MKMSYVAVLFALLGSFGAAQANAQAASLPSSMQSTMSLPANVDSLTPLTRAQVYRQLVSAERHGVLQQGDTVYPRTATSHRPNARVTRASVEHSLRRAEQQGLLTEPRNAYPVLHVAPRTSLAWKPKMQVAGEASIQHLYENP